ncbi:hypothetical protein MTO96_042458 [Rhipicephalus appendiculatus]
MDIEGCASSQSCNRAKNFAVVKFPDDEDAVAVVPASWVIGQVVMWPVHLVKESADELAKKCIEPGAGWVANNARVLGWYETYERARTKLPLAEMTSDIDTDLDRPRRRRRNRIYDDSSSGDSPDEEEPANSTTLPRAPTPPVRIAHTMGKDHQHPSSVLSKKAKKDHVPSQKRYTAASSSSKQEEQACRYSQASPPDSEVLRLLHSIQCRQLQHSSQLNMITAWIASRTSVLDEAETQDIEIPRTLDAFIQFDDSVAKSKELQKQLKAHWKKFGGISMPDTVKRIMRDMLSDEVASNYSWQGAKGKLHFRETACCQILLEIAAASPHYQSATTSDVEVVIKSWLRHSKERLIKKRTSAPEKQHQA